MQRQALHALRLSFVHPVTQENKLFMADPPEDFASALRILGLSYNLSEGPEPLAGRAVCLRFVLRITIRPMIPIRF